MGGEYEKHFCVLALAVIQEPDARSARIND
jgi:hypothetical protein